MKFSVIIPTLNRIDELILMLDSLQRQSFKNFEVLIIDQNKEEILDKKIEIYKNHFPVKQIKITTKGASNARNIGIQNAKGEILTFPDDDCEFPDNFLEQINTYFQKNNVDGITVSTKDRNDGKPISILLSSKGQKISRRNILKTVIEAGIIIKRDEIDDVLFDVNMGVGSIKSTYWSDEGPDFILNLIGKGKTFYFCPQFKMFHPNPVKTYNDKTAIRSYQYGKGRGYFLRKHKFGLFSISYYLIIYIIGMLKGIVFLNPQMIKYFKQGFKGRYEGYFQSK